MKYPIVLLLPLALFSPARAECVQCPTPPCEIAACPPDEIPMFANITIGTETASIGEYVELSSGIELVLSDVAVSTEFGGYAEYTFDLSEPGEVWLALSLKEYAWNGSAWVYNATVDEGFVFVIQAGTGEPSREQCRLIGLTECGLYMENCLISECSRSRWCPTEGDAGYCVIVTGDCVDTAADGCSGCSAKTPGCVGITADPVKVAKKYCREGYRCIMDIQEAG